MTFLRLPAPGYGYVTVGVPGALAGLIRLQSEHGTLPLATLMAPAIEYAENGFRLLSGQAMFHRMTAGQLAETEGARTSYLKSDLSPYRAGDLLRQPVLARTLRRISEGGADLFYRGEIAEAMAADMEANGGFLTLQSLADYRAEDSRIVRGSYRGYDLVALDVPASGSIAIQALQIMENFERSEYSPEEWATVVGQAIGLALPDLGRLGSDSAAVRATSKEWAETQAEHVQIGAAVGSGAGEASQMQQLHDNDPSYTTHLSVADSAGMVVSFTQTIGPAMGSRVVTPDLGFLYAVTLGGYLGGAMAPGDRARSGITPLFVLRDGEPVLVLGAAGGLKIISAVVQSVSRVVDDAMSLPEALIAPRVHPDFDATLTFTGLSLESSGPMGWTEQQIEIIRAMGFAVSSSSMVGTFGRVHGISYDKETGRWLGVADPDGEGTALGRGR